MSEFDSPEAQEADQKAHRKLVDDIVLAFGLLGSVDNYWRVFNLLPDDSAKRFGEEAFKHPLYEEDGHEAVATFFETQVNLMPYTRYLEFEDFRWRLNSLGEAHFTILMKKFEREPDKYSYVQSMIDTAVSREIDEL